MLPFILIDAVNSKNQTLLNHEKIHIQQQMELLIVPFYVFYLLNYFINLIAYRNHNKAYRNIVFEREAYQNEINFDYLKTRNPFSFLKHL